jgi:hypothetical protein
LLWGARPDADIADEATWRASSPHWSKDRRDLMARKYAAALAGQDEPEFDDPDPIRGWAAQYLNIWPLLLNPRGDALVMPDWPRCVTSSASPPIAALGVAIDLDRVWVSVGAASKGEVPHLATVSVLRDGEPVTLRRRLDTDRAFVVSEVARIQRETGCLVVLDRKGGAKGGLEDDLMNAGVVVTGYAMDDYLSACADLFDAVGSKNVEHGDYDELNDAVSMASRQTVGDRWKWGRRNGDVSMLEAVTLAFRASQAANYDVADSIG